MPDEQPITVYKGGRSIQVSRDAFREAWSKGWRTNPTGTETKIGPPPTGMAAVKSFGYTQADKLKNLILDNADMLTGAVGGGLGAPGGPITAVGGATLGGMAGRALQQLYGASKGKPQPSSGEAALDIGAGGLQQGAAEAGGALLGKLGKLIKPATKAESLSFALGSERGAVADIPKLIEKVIPDLNKTVKTGSRNMRTVGDLQKVVAVTKRRLDTEFNIALQPIAEQEMVPISVSDAIRAKITPAMSKTPEGRATENYLRKKATQFETPWTMQELNDERMRVTARLDAYHGAAPSGQSAMVRIDASKAADQATESALKDLVYDAADRSPMSTKPTGYFRELKQKHGALIALQDQVKKQIEHLSNVGAARRGAPLREKMHIAGYAHPATGAPGGVLRATPSMFSNPEAMADAAVRRAYPGKVRGAYQGARKAVGTALSNRDINALPIRVLMGDYSGMEDTGP